MGREAALTHGRGRVRGKAAAWVAAIGAGLSWLALAPPAQAEITEVFAESGTPVPCEVLSGADEGIRFCTDTPRSTVPTFDGVPIDVNVAFPPEPELGPDRNFPVVMMFHGYAGTKIGLNGMRRWLNQGYATFSMTTRGFGESCGSLASRTDDPAGCANGFVRLMDTRYEVRDAQELITQLYDEGLVDRFAIGATGQSYGGGMSMALSALVDRKMLPDGSLVNWESAEGDYMSIAVSAPQIPWTDLAYSIAPTGSALDYVHDSPYFGPSGRIGVEKQAWVGTLYLQGFIAPTGGFYAPEGTPGADLTGWKATLDTGGPYDDNPAAVAAVEEIMAHHSAYYIQDSTPPPPMMITSGWTDDLFPANEGIRFYNRTRTNHPDTPIALNLADYGHPRAQNKAATAGAIVAAENAWFAYYLKGEGSEPPARVQALTQTCPAGNATPPGGPFVADTYDQLAPGEVRFEHKAAKTISATGTQYGPNFGNTPASPSPPPPATACTQTDGANNPATANYRLDPAPPGGYTLMGSPTVIARFALPGQNSQVAARLLDVAPGGQQTLVARALWRPKVTGDKAVKQVFQLNPNGWTFEEDHVPKLELLPQDAPFGSSSPGQKPVEVSNLKLRLPVLDEPGALDGLVEEPLEKFVPRGYYLARGFDAGPPQTRIDRRPKAKAKSRRAFFGFASSDLDSSFECKLDRGSFEECGSSASYGGLARKRHVFRVRAIDPDENVDPTPARWAWRIR
jgi:hypothetical protein